MTIVPNHILKLMSKEDRKSLGKAGITAEEIAAKTIIKCEKDLHDLVIGHLRRNGLPFDHSRMDRKTTNAKGEPDFKIFKDNKVLFIELKHEDGRLSDDQIKRIQELAAAGNRVYVMHSYEATVRVIESHFKN